MVSVVLAIDIQILEECVGWGRYGVAVNRAENAPPGGGLEPWLVAQVQVIVGGVNRVPESVLPIPMAVSDVKIFQLRKLPATNEFKNPALGPRHLTGRNTDVDSVDPPRLRAAIAPDM